MAITYKDAGVNIEEGYIITDCVANERGDVIVKCSKNESEYKYYFIEVG